MATQQISITKTIIKSLKLLFNRCYCGFSFCFYFFNFT